MFTCVVKMAKLITTGIFLFVTVIQLTKQVTCDPVSTVTTSPLAVVEVIEDVNGDLVTQLPGLDFKPDFKHYSGYLNGTGDRKLHYWFVESERSPSEDPLVVWMNGGPGCSSLLGFLTEQGPFTLTKSDSSHLTLNPYRWNQVANVLFLEAPAGVGFSYRENSEDLSTDDNQVARDNHQALKDFYLRYPQFVSNPLFITGESYAGIYVPTLSVEILRNSPDINLQGFAIGNGYLDQDKLGNSLLLFGYFHGLYGQKTWNNLIKSCCSYNSTGNTRSSDIFSTLGRNGGCSPVTNLSKECKKAVEIAYKAISADDLNMYNLYQDCDFPEEAENGLRERLELGPWSTHRIYHDRKLVRRTLGLNTSKLAVNEEDEDPPCTNDNYLRRYLNQQSVRKALHIPSNVAKWTSCSTEVGQTYTNVYKTVKPLVLELLKAGKRGLIYNGDVDMACNFLGDEWFVDELGLPVVSEYTEWHLKNQVAGYVKHFDGLVFATVKGSGHMVPTDKPAAALSLIVGFLE